MESTEFSSQISSSVFFGEANLKLVSEDGQHVLTHQLLFSLHSSFMWSLLEASSSVSVTVCVPVASETLTSLISLLTCGQVRVDGESVYFEEDEISEAATILGIDLRMLKVELCRNEGNEEVESVKKKEILKSNFLGTICDVEEEQVNLFEINFFDQENEDVESVEKKEMFKSNLSSEMRLKPFKNVFDLKEEQVNLFDKKKAGIHRDYAQYKYTRYSGAESWLFENYPDLFHLWRQSCDNEKDIENTDYSFQNRDRSTCRVCNANVPTIRKHYGVRMCESDKQFLKRTFHLRVLYPQCATGLCPPRPRGWCQSCRLRRCLSTPLTLHLVRVGDKKFMEDERL